MLSSSVIQKKLLQTDPLLKDDNHPRETKKEDKKDDGLPSVALPLSNVVGQFYERPWGNYQTLSIVPDRYQVKILNVNPGGRLSLQRHLKRSEHWVVVAGQPTLTIDSQTRTCQVNDSMFVPCGIFHRIENNTRQVCKLIEVQVGNYLGEDDIERIDDAYGRAKIT